MQKIAVFKDGKVVNNEAIKMLKTIEDGTYLMDLIILHPKTCEQNRNLFFYRLNQVARSIGEKPDYLYKLFKEEMNIGSLSGNISLEQWHDVNTKFKEYVWNNLEIPL